ncbi:MAG: DUF1631 family protein [Rhodoferax sp.]|uniref:DUF1631 family protein n=1 Tax=Rhodoferax sp. TaxID=50421 RepID=UPI002614D3D3|nr:DUF1631 family protein [Rhodoferax sp.]MDD2882075.1 DUF1631 family protein [Rhodoferax sp.]
MSSPVLPGSSRSLYRDLLAQASAGSAAMLSRALAQARQSMRDEATRAQGLLARDHLALSVKLLDAHASQLCMRYPQALDDAFRRHDAPESRLGVVATQGLRLDQLELMDESQVHERVETARAIQHMLLISESALTEFNTYVCALQGHKQVTASRNPLRPDAYVAALQEVMDEIGLPLRVRTAWVQHVSGALGAALNAEYASWVAQLRGQGVQPAVFSVRRTAETSTPQHVTASRGARAPWSPQHRQTVLTLDRLRRLMAGELAAEPCDPKEAFARQFAQEFEVSSDQPPVDTGFEATVPAALEALQDMQQVDHLVSRMAQRPGFTLAPKGVPNAELPVREQLMRQAQAQGMAQVLSLEVVALMVDNLVQDSRLLLPIRDLISRLEPALLRLVLVDARFFSDRQHPARRLLQEIAQKGLAFGSVDDAHFNVFLVALQRFVSPLASMQIDSAEPFELALKSLTTEWSQAAARTDVSSQMDTAVAALEFAESRNLLADKMVAGMQSMAELQQVPQSLLDFLFGPWAQVMACAQLNDQSHADDPGGYKALVHTLLWSAQPELTRKNIDKLTRLVPRLLPTLRAGLRLIDYPATKTSVFFDVLMQLHQQAFRPVQAKPATQERPDLAASLLGDQAHWVAPAEAKASGFMDLPDDFAGPQEPVAVEKSAALLEMAAPGYGELGALSVGTWIELLTNDIWSRTQLSWISPQRTMYLFTSVQGKTQSMTQRMLERLHGSGRLRVLSEQSMVDGALDAVVQTAMLNSLDLRVV